MKKQNGFTLIEAMLSVVIVGILSMALINTTVTMSKSAVTAERSQAETALMYEVDNILNSPKACTKALFTERTTPFPNVNGTPLSLYVAPGTSTARVAPTTTSITDPSMVGGATVTYGSGLNITGVSLQNVTSLGGLNYRADVQVTGKKLGSVVGDGTFTNTAGFYYQTDATNSFVQNCISASASPQVNCESLGGTWTGGALGATSSSSCGTMGGTWAGTPASCTSSMAGTCNYCTTLGGTASGTTCSFGGAAATPTPTPTASAGTDCVVPAGTSFTGMSSLGVVEVCTSDTDVTIPTGATGLLSTNVNTSKPDAQGVANQQVRHATGQATFVCSSSGNFAQLTMPAATCDVTGSSCAVTWGYKGLQNSPCDGYCNGDPCSGGDPGTGAVDECGTSAGSGSGGCTEWSIHCTAGFIRINGHSHAGGCY